MPICQIFLHAEKKFPPSVRQFLDDIFNIVASKNWFHARWELFSACKKICQIHIFLLFLFYILIFWAQKCWFIELTLALGSAEVCYFPLPIPQKSFPIT